ncbi:hypothetical protein PtB15_4B163 [Puccinia triticina]|nr:hypothetical protein PtB15_4B163 [Puccinia triticina]
MATSLSQPSGSMLKLDEPSSVNPESVMFSDSAGSVRLEIEPGKTPAKSMKPTAPEPQLPHPISSLTRSIVEFAKFMMGTTGRDYQLPDPPTTEELKYFEFWNISIQNNQDTQATQRPLPPQIAIGDDVIQDKVENDLPGIDYKPAPIPPNYEISKHVKHECDAQFCLRGLPRITFQWNKPSLKTSPWNSASAQILADQWHSWYLEKRHYSRSTKLKVDARAVIARWLKTAAGKQRRITKEELSLREFRLDHFKEQHKQARRQIGLSRRMTAHACFPKHKNFFSKLYEMEVVSDYDYEADDDDDEAPPTRILPYWRSKVLGDLSHELDLAAIQLASPEEKPTISKLLQRRETRDATEFEASLEKIPLGAFTECFSDEFLQDTSVLERRQLQINETTQPYSLSQALADLQKLTCKENARPID